MTLSTMSVKLQCLSKDPFLVHTTFSRPGVRNGYLLPAVELASHAEAWNDTRVVINHPKKDGIYVSAKTPDIPFVGRLYDAAYDEGLAGTMQLEVQSAKDAGIYDRLISGETMEVSAAFFCDVEQKVGVYEGQTYIGISRNIVPDHIALLPFDLGACSVTDGCGAFVANEAMNGIPLNRISWVVQDALYAIGLWPISVFANYAIASNDHGKLFKIPYTFDDQLVVTLGEAMPIRLQIIEEATMPTDESTATVAEGQNDEIMALVDQLGGRSELERLLAERVQKRADVLAILSQRHPGVNFTTLPTDQLEILVVQASKPATPSEPTGFGPLSSSTPTYLPIEAIK